MPGGLNRSSWVRAQAGQLVSFGGLGEKCTLPFGDIGRRWTVFSPGVTCSALVLKDTLGCYMEN